MNVLADFEMRLTAAEEAPAGAGKTMKKTPRATTTGTTGKKKTAPAAKAGGAKKKTSA